jgi:16S rRNA G966 N2-methylase RsmD
MTLVNEMLDTLPEKVWKNPNLKWLDPSAGMGNFPIAVYMRLMEGLKSVIEDDEKRRKHILENMLYMVELDNTNVSTMKKIFCDEKYELNIFEGSFIDFKHFKKVNIELKFDVILGNPPFQYKEENKQAQLIWHLFIKRSYEELLEEKGYLLFIHPSGWRDIDGITRFIYNYIKQHNLIYLSMNTYKDGQRVFGVGTNFDYYLVQNIKTNNNLTLINDIDNKKYKINLNNWDFIPSGNFNQFKKILNKKERINVLYDSSMYEVRKPYTTNILYNRSMYGTDKKNMSDLINLLRDSSSYHTQKKWIINNKTIYPCIYTISKKDGCKFKYSDEKKGHFGIPKVIWSNGSGTPIIDINGDYGLTEFAYAVVDDKKNLQKIKDAMISEKFINLMKYVVFKKDNKYNYKIIALFKKDFYKYFII